MRKHLIFTFMLFLAMPNVYADMQSDQALELAQAGVIGTDANGEPQTTFVDENGNLKMVPIQVNPKGPFIQPPSTTNRTPRQPITQPAPSAGQTPPNFSPNPPDGNTNVPPGLPQPPQTQVQTQSLPEDVTMPPNTSEITQPYQTGVPDISQ